jgi:hypothetical protein
MDSSSLGWVLAQAVAPPDASTALSTDLRWLRLPSANTDTIVMTLFVLMAVAVIVIATLLAQSWFQSLLGRFPRANKRTANQQVSRLEPELQELLNRLTPLSGLKSAWQLIQDPLRIEEAVARYVADAPLSEDLKIVSRFRRKLGLTVMNAAVPVTSTRQLLPDLIVRLVASIGTDKLDVYCPLLEVSERYFLVDLPYHRDLYNLLKKHPDVFLLYWRESDGETPFRVHLVPLESERISAFRCEHVLRSEDDGNRQDFRLTMDLPTNYQFVERDALMEHRQSGKEISATKGEARLVDLSHGGAALLCDRPLDVHGFAQLHFDLRGHAMRVMMEVLKLHEAPEGKTLVHGQFRGLTPEMRGRLHSALTNEQFKRIQLREAIVVNTRTPEPQPDPTPLAEPEPESGPGPRTRTTQFGQAKAISEGKSVSDSPIGSQAPAQPGEANPAKGSRTQPKSRSSAQADRPPSKQEANARKQMGTRTPDAKPRQGKQTA